MPTRAITVGTTTTPIASYNNRRTTMSLSNNGTAQIFVSNDAVGILTGGYNIEAGGALDLLRALGDEPELQWFGIVASGTVNMRVLEGFGQLPVLFTPPSLPSQQEALL